MSDSFGGPTDTIEIGEEGAVCEAREEIGTKAVKVEHSPLSFNTHTHLGPFAYMSDTPPCRMAEDIPYPEVTDDVVDSPPSFPKDTCMEEPGSGLTCKGAGTPSEDTWKNKSERPPAFTTAHTSKKLNKRNTLGPKFAPPQNIHLNKRRRNTKLFEHRV